ncbi:MFS transporter [Streptomyces triticagri]|uniref:MFS transporter n=1 Tax=Streptomyces triticagri TaxID=2293568 RepID=A0A372MCM2_9ACTN|nr:MFS transporter [Streptomyces triticagri]RFU88255.1 MFS transporter [Streptomyces triticagri]
MTAGLRSTTAPTAPGTRPRAALAAGAAGAGIVALDGTVLLVAQPSLGHELGATVGQVQWTSTGYLLAVAALLVIAGRLGDRYGHPRLLVVGSLGFAAASAGIALAPGIGWVVGLRVLQGVFGALLQPATLALLQLAYPAERLAGAIAVRTGVIGVAAGAGPLLGGVLVDQFGWRAVFVVNIPVALAIAGLTLAVRVPVRPHEARAERLDVVGAALLTTALAAGVHALAGVPEHAWTSARTVCGLVAAGALAALFGRHERRAAQPIVPAEVARSVPVTASTAMLLVTSGGMFGALFAATFHFQGVLGLGPSETALHVLPMTVLMVLGAPAAGAALGRFGARRTALAGQLLVVVAVLSLARLGPGTPWPVTGAMFAALGAGFATVMVTATGTVVGDAPPGYAGVVGGLKQTAMNIGPALGIAIASGLMPSASAGVHAPDMASAAAPDASTAGPAYLVLAGVTALGLVPAALLPVRPGRADGANRSGRPAPPARPAPPHNDPGAAAHPHDAGT